MNKARRDCDKHDKPFSVSTKNYRSLFLKSASLMSNNDNKALIRDKTLLMKFLFGSMGSEWLLSAFPNLRSPQATTTTRSLIHSHLSQKSGFVFIGCTAEENNEFYR